MTAAGLERRVSATLPAQGRKADAARRGQDVAEDRDLRSLRDQLTEAALTDGTFPGLKILRREAWWDGAITRTCLTVQWRKARWRLLVLDADTVVPLPAGSRAARKQLDRYRAALGRPALDESVPGRHEVVLLPPAPAAVLPSVTGDDPEHALLSARLRTLRANSSGTVVVEQVGDWVTCSRPGCAALVPLPPPGDVVDVSSPYGPVCGRCG